ncbi:MAG: ABC transporter permease [Gordonia sp. (in: high G+C Gram-positive bacteria)]
MIIATTVPAERPVRGLSPAGRRRWTGAALLSPAIVTLLLFVVVPTLFVIRNSVAIADNYGGIVGGFTLANYRDLFDPVYLKVLGYSLAMSSINTVFCLVVGYLTAAYIVSRPPARQGLVLVAIVVPFWTDFLVRTFAWITLLSDGGPIVTMLRTIGVVHGDTHWLPSQGAVLAGLLYSFLPAAIFPIYASMRGIDTSLREAAEDLGCNWWITQRRILIPLCRPGLVAAAVLTFIPTLGVFVIPVLLGGGKNQLIGNLIVTLYTEFRNQPMGAAAATVLLVVMFTALAVAGVLLRRGRRKEH